MNKQDKEKFFVLVAGILLLVAGITTNILYHKRINFYLTKGFKVTYGNIIYLGSSGRAGTTATYRYYVNGKYFEGDIEIRRFCTRQSRDLCVFESLNIPVIYSTEKPNLSLILLKHSDYEKWGLPYPDSIKKYLHFYFECADSYSAVREERKGINPKWRKCDD